jgi:hypothetical protein
VGALERGSVGAWERGSVGRPNGLCEKVNFGLLFLDESTGMKRISLILGIALTLSSGTADLRAGGCGGGCGFCPFWPLALFGAGVAIASAASAHSSPTYVYAPPPYPYYYPYGYPQSPAPSSQPPAQNPSESTAPAMSSLEQAAHWVPSSPGAGHWVPDSTPYVYEPAAQSKLVAVSAQPAAQLVTVNRSAGQVPVYTVTH